MHELTFGDYGGRYVPETLIPALDELERRLARRAPTTALPRGAARARSRPTPAGPTPLTLAERFAPGKRLYLKREDLLHTGAHKLNNALGQAVLARRLGKHADRRRDRRRPARRRDGDRLRALRARVRRLHGRGGHAPPGGRTSSGCGLLGAEVRAGRVRHAHAEGGDERGDPRLDRERRDDPLPDRLLRRPGAVPGDRARAAGA